MPGAGYENRCRAEKLPFTTGSSDSGHPFGLYAAAGYADSTANTGNPGRAAIFNAAANSCRNPNAGPGKANGNAGGNRQRG